MGCLLSSNWRLLVISVGRISVVGLEVWCFLCDGLLSSENSLGVLDGCRLTPTIVMGGEGGHFS